MPAQPNKPIKIVGNWGTTNLTLWRLDDGSAASGPGVSQRDRGGLFAALKQCLKKLNIAPDETAILLSGMAGSNIGLHTAAYLPCGTTLDTLQDQTDWHTEHGLTYGLVPGMKFKSGDTVDVMRGEETEALGWMNITGRRDGTLCIPGTHTKWITLKGGAITGFTTSLTGELFSILSTHSILLGDVRNGFDRSAFKDGVAAAKRSGKSGLLHQLFQTRARQIDGALPTSAASSFLSGLIIGHDILGAERYRAPSPIGIIAAPALTEPYMIGLDMFDLPYDVTPAHNAAFQGLSGIAHKLEQST